MWRPTGCVARSPSVSGKTTPACDSGVADGGLRRRFTSVLLRLDARSSRSRTAWPTPSCRGQHRDDDVKACVVGGPECRVQAEGVLARVSRSRQAHVGRRPGRDVGERDQPERCRRRRPRASAETRQARPGRPWRGRRVVGGGRPRRPDAAGRCGHLAAGELCNLFDGDGSGAKQPGSVVPGADDRRLDADVAAASVEDEVAADHRGRRRARPGRARALVGLTCP